MEGKGYISSYGFEKHYVLPAKCASLSGPPGLGFKKVGDLPKWFAFNFSSNDLSVALGNSDSSSRIERMPIYKVLQLILNIDLD